MNVRLGLLVAGLVAVLSLGAGRGVAGTSPATQCAPPASYPAATTPIAFWSTEARCAIVPSGLGGVFGPENFGNKFPGEAAVYMGIVHAAIYDAAVAIQGGYTPYTTTPPAPDDTSPEAAIATAAYYTLTGLQPQLGAAQTILDTDYGAYMASIADGPAKSDGVAVGRQAAEAVLALRQNDGRGCSTTIADLGPPSPGPGVWQPNPTGPVLGLCLPGMRPLALGSASQFRPNGPNALTSNEYANDLNQVEDLGRAGSTSRTAAQTNQAWFWTDHDIRQWNDGLLGLAHDYHLDLVQTARLLAMAHVAGGDAMIACFDAKYHYWFWRPYQAIHLADTDGNPDTVADASWLPLGATPNFPEYPSAHACHSTGVVEALDAFFGTDKVSLTLTSRAPNVTVPTRDYDRLHDVVKDVDWARVLVGFHFRNSDLQGSALGRKVAGFVVDHLFQPADAAPAQQPAAAKVEDKDKVKAKIDHGILTVTGTGGDDTVALRLRQGDPTVLDIDVGNDGAPDLGFKRDKFDQIAVSLANGDDTFVVDESNGAFTDTEITTVDGGAGDDTVTGGSGGETFSGQAGSDTILGMGGGDVLHGGGGNDALTGGDGDDQAFGEAGDDHMVWNPGDDTDLDEGGDGTDTVDVNGGNGAEVFTTAANGTRVSFARLSPAPFSIDIGTSEVLASNMNGGDDSFSATGNIAALIQITVDGGGGNDTIRGGNGADTLLGSDGNDFVDGNQGNDVAMLGAGDDAFVWDPGDGSDTVEGQAGADTMLFNGGDVDESFNVSANGGRVRLTRNVGNVIVDVDAVERISVRALGGADGIVVDDLAGTGVSEIDAVLAGSNGGGDGAADTIVVDGTDGSDVIDAFGDASLVSVTGLAAGVRVTGAEASNDTLTINARAGDDVVSATGLTADAIRLVANGEDGDDVLLGGDGDDTLTGGNGDDVLIGGPGVDILDGGPGNNIIIQD